MAKDREKEPAEASAERVVRDHSSAELMAEFERRLRAALAEDRRTRAESEAEAQNANAAILAGLLEVACRAIVSEVRPVLEEVIAAERRRLLEQVERITASLSGENPAEPSEAPALVGAVAVRGTVNAPAPPPTTAAGPPAGVTSTGMPMFNAPRVRVVQAPR